MSGLAWSLFGDSHGEIAVLVLDDYIFTAKASPATMDRAMKQQKGGVE